MTEQPHKRFLTTERKQFVRVNLLRLAGLAAGLGLFMEILLVVGGQTNFTAWSLAGNGLWPFLVCLGVGVGQVLTSGSPPRAGAFALVTAPAAFLFAQVLQKWLAVVLNNDYPGGYITGPLLLETVLRTVEYVVLAGALAWVARQPWGKWLAHLALGLVLGALFGVVIALLLPPDSLLGWVVEELVFPAGCSLIVFVSETVTEFFA